MSPRDAVAMVLDDVSKIFGLLQGLVTSALGCRWKDVSPATRLSPESSARTSSGSPRTVTRFRLRSVAADFGISESKTGIAVFFADPKSAWQRGTNENTNGLLRQYFPEGTDLSLWSNEANQVVAATLNSRPRKVLRWKNRPKPSTGTYGRSNEPVLRRPVESGRISVTETQAPWSATTWSGPWAKPEPPPTSLS